MGFMHRRFALQLARFGAVGATNTALTFVVYAVAVHVGVGYLPAAAGAFGLGAVNGFLLNRTWTFQHAGRSLAAARRYAVVQGASMVENVGLLWVMVHLLGLGRLPGEALAAVPVTLVSFALSRAWVFRAGAGPARQADCSRYPMPRTVRISSGASGRSSSFSRRWRMWTSMPRGSR